MIRDLNQIRQLTFAIDFNEFPADMILCAIAELGKTYWIGNNNKKTHPKMIKRFGNGHEASCCHAEVDAIAKVPRQSRHLINLYVLRFHKNGNITMAKPCRLCQNFLKENNISFKNVFFTDWDGNWQRLSNG